MDYNRVKLGMYEDPRRQQNDEEELLIFGYSCKLFRDDERALSIENGEHLIPWMDDSSLMIDRFDVRGALYDLREAEGKGKPSMECISEVELKEEQLCEQERYLALYHDEEQYQMDCEEEAKRLQVALASDGSYYNQVGYSYVAQYEGGVPPAQYEGGVPVEPPTMPTKPEPVTAPEPVSFNPSSDDDTFVPPPEMNILPNMEIPKTVKQNKIILKTAKFVVSQGAQMEIIIKTKQAGNPMFNFLAFDNHLNAYYKHVVCLVRTGRYRFDDDADSATKSDQSDQYLHPDLSQKVRPDLTPGVAASPARPSPHCTYSKLITKIKEKQKAGMEDSEIPSPILPSSPVHESRAPPPPKGLSFEPVVGLVDYPSFNQTADGVSDTEEAEIPFVRRPPKAAVHDYSHIKWPPPEIQMVIDKMASYITKNGSAFEEVVKSRGDARFDFLHKHHEYFPYYKCKLQLYSEVYGDVFKNVLKNQKKTNAGVSVKAKTSPSETVKNGGSRTISFSIKSREQEVSLTSHTTFPIESSTSEEDEEMEEEEREKRRFEREKRRKERKSKEDKERKEREELIRRERQRKEEEERKKEKEDESSGNEDLYDIFKYAQEMERDSVNAPPTTGSPAAASRSPEEGNSKQEERKKKAAAFLSKIKESKEDQKPLVYGPQMPPDIAAGMARSATQSPSSSSGSSEREKPPIPPPPSDPPPPPLPKSPSPLVASYGREKSKSVSREISASPKRGKSLLEDTNTMASVLLSGLNEFVTKGVKDGSNDIAEGQSRKSRSRKKHQRQKSASGSPERKRERKKRKRSRGSTHHRRKKRRSTSRSRSGRGHSKSRRSSHKKKQSKHSSRRDKERSRKKKHKRRRSPSSVSSLPSSPSSSISAPSSLPSETESEREVQVIESDDAKKSSRDSSIVSLPSVSSASRNSEPKKLSVDPTMETDDKSSSRVGLSASGGEEDTCPSPAPTPAAKYARTLLLPIENSNSSEATIEAEKRPAFNPNTSSAMAKIAQGLRAKLHALLEEENKLK